MEKKAYYLTTTLPYVNAAPHIGFALEIVQADILARYWRLTGREVFFSTGTDEHGQKIWQKAKETDTDVQEYVDHYAAQFGKLRDALDLSYDAFIRTTDEKHIKAAQELWKRCEVAGDIYKKKYKGLYCVGDEAYMKESDLVNGRCPNHPNQDLIEIEEENYFFRLSKYQDRLAEYLANPAVIVPEWRREEAIRFVLQGLEDFSISRETARMSWGIPVPGDDSQVMYVWFDALTNYISTIDWPDEGGNFKKFWVDGETYQMAGKDQVRFQSIMWQAMLMSANIPTTQHVLYHGFITSGGQKMSKSLGNVIDPYELIAEYGTDAVRYFLARHIHPFEDSDFTMERFKELYNADLANGLGNVVSRVMRLSEQYLKNPLLSKEDTLTFQYSKKFEEHFRHFEFNAALDTIWSYVRKSGEMSENELYVSTLHRVLQAREQEPITAVSSVLSINQAMQSEQPFKVVKEDKERAIQIITMMVREIALIGKALEPFMPHTSKIILDAVKENKKPENLFARKD